MYEPFALDPWNRRTDMRIAFVSFLVFAAVLIVTACEGRADPNFTTIKAAIAAAEPGDVIHIPAGTYRERVILRSGGITLVGAGADKTIIDGAGLPSVVRGAKDAALVGMTIENGEIGVDMTGCFMGIFDCRIRDCSISGIRVKSGSGIIVNNVITGHGKHGA